MKVMLLDNNEPTSYGEAMVGPDSDKWLEAMKSEIVSIYQNKAWTLMDLPDDRQSIEINGSFKKKTDVDGRKAVGYRWILKGRQTMMVRITIKKARLVVKIFSDKFKELITVRFSHS